MPALFSALYPGTPLEMLREALWRVFGWKGHTTLTDLRNGLQAANERIGALESEQTRRDIEWRETKEQIKRHLSRAAAFDQRAQQRAEAADGHGAGQDPKRLAAVLAMKYPGKGG